MDQVDDLFTQQAEADQNHGDAGYHADPALQPGSTIERPLRGVPHQSRLSFIPDRRFRDLRQSSIPAS